VGRGPPLPLRQALRGADGTIGVRLTLHDEGSENRRVTAASAVFHIEA
jgi:hypothetical protein